MILESIPVIPTTIQAKAQPTFEWRPLYLFNLYRLVIVTVFTATFIAGVSPGFLGQFDGRLFLVTTWFYLGLSLLNIVTIQSQWPRFSLQVLTQILIDIFVITLLMHASGGVNSGLGTLLVVAIAGGSLLAVGRTAFFFAAIASLCVLVQVTLMDIYDWSFGTSYTHAGLLGVTFFATAFLAFVLAQRVRISEALAKQRGLHVQYLARLNAQIVQHIQSGIIVIDVKGYIRLFNEAARRLLGLTEQPEGQLLTTIVPELARRLANWQKGQSTMPPLFHTYTGEVEILATFTALKDQEGTLTTLVVLEDATLMTQRAQQLKLASLGRLTASIAHEIRNPLGAISHAGQLLTESVISSNEYHKRLTQIIVDNAQRVNTIIENVLQLSRQKTIDTQCFNLYAWLVAFTEEFISFQGLASTDIIIHTQKRNLIVCFDPSHLYQVINNLCENGLRYSQGTPRLELHTGVSEESARPYLDICDHGTGMTKEIQRQIFEPFFTTETMGSGLGLYIAREICEANQAALHMISNTPTGCCFRIYFSEYNKHSLD